MPVPDSFLTPADSPRELGPLGPAINRTAGQAEEAWPDGRDFPLLQLAYQTFVRELPDLLRDYPDQFVAYQGSVRLRIDGSPWELEAMVASLPQGTGAVFNIQPEDDPDEDRTPAFL